MPPRKKKAAAPPPEPRPPRYRWTDRTSYSQTVGHRRGEKEPTKFELVNANQNSIFSSDSPFCGLTIERERSIDGAPGWRVTARPATVFLRTDTETAEMAMEDAPFILLIELRRRVAALEAAITTLDESSRKSP